MLFEAALKPRAIQPSRSKTRALSGMKHVSAFKKYADSTAFGVTVENIASDMATAASCLNAHAFFDVIRQYHPAVYFDDASFGSNVPVPTGWMRGFLSQYLYLMNAHGYDAAASMGDMPAWTDDYLMHHLKETVASVLLDLVYDNNIPADMAGKISKKAALKLADFPDASVLHSVFAIRLFIDGLLSGVDRLEDSFYSLAVFESDDRKSGSKGEDVSIYDLGGRQVFHSNTVGNEIQVPLPTDAVYLVKIGYQTIKIAL